MEKSYKSPLKAAFVSVLFGNLITAGLSFTLNVVLSRFLTVSEYGRISLIFSLVITFFTIADFGISNTTIIFYNRFKGKYIHNPLHYLNSYYLRFWLMILVLSGLIIFTLIRQYFNLSLYESIVIYSVFLPFMLFRYLNSCNQAHGKWLYFNILNISNKVLQFSAIFLGVLLFYTILGQYGRYQSVLYGYNIYPLLLLIISLIFNHGYLHFKRDVHGAQNVLKDLSKIALPLGLTNVFVIISMRFGYLATDKILGSEELGIFSAANTLALVFPLITTSLMNVLLRETATQKETFLKKIIANQKQYAPILLIFLFLAILLSKYFIVFIFGDKYIASIPIFRILLIPYIGGIFFTPLQSYFYSHRPKTIMTVQFMQMLVIICGSLIFINIYGLIGVALSIMLSRIAVWIYISFSAHSIIRQSESNDAD